MLLPKNGRAHRRGSRMANGEMDILMQAIARNAAAVLSVPAEKTFEHHKSRLLRDEPDRFWIDASRQSSAAADALVARQAAVGVSFRAGPQKITFTAPVMQFNGAFQINADTTTRALQLKFPTEIHAIQRRSAYRVHVPINGDLAFRMWRIPEHVYFKDRPGTAQELPAQVIDLSTGGLGVMLFSRGEDTPRITMNQRVRISMQFRDEEELLLEGRVRYFPPSVEPGKAMRCGIQFKKLESNIEGRQILSAINHIIAELPREETRRARLGLPAQ
jgi:c-di-GMP-binding flagellar brake protein YcgR